MTLLDQCLTSYIEKCLTIYEDVADYMTGQQLDPELAINRQTREWIVRCDRWLKRVVPDYERVF